MKRIAILLILALPTTFFAQGGSTKKVTEFILDFHTTDSAPFILLANNVHFRKSPSLKGEIMNLLPIGTEMIVLKKSDETLILNGVKSAWYEVRVGIEDGYIWGGFISHRSIKSTSNPSVTFVFGLYGLDQKKEWEKQYQIRAFSNKKQLDQFVFKSFSQGIGDLKSRGNTGLGIDDIVSLEVPCVGGKGCRTGSMLFFWDNNQFSSKVDLIGTADDFASATAALIFPNDPEGEKGTVVRQMDLYIDGSADSKVNRKEVREFYKWDGKTLVLDTERKPETKFYTIEH